MRKQQESKIPTAERAILIAKSIDRVQRFLSARREFSKVNWEEVEWADRDVGAEQEALRAVLRKKYNLPANVYIAEAECNEDYATRDRVIAMLKKIILQKCSSDDLFALVWHCEECDEIDLGWVYFERPQGYYQAEKDSFWEGRVLLEVLNRAAGLPPIKGMSVEESDREVILYALQNPPSRTKNNRPGDVMESLKAGSDPMQAIRDLIGDHLVEAF